MAQHCFNYHFKTNERYMNEMERSRPLQESDDQLLQDCFKEQFQVPVHEWLLIQTDKKRELLYEFLRGNRPRKPAKTLRCGLNSTNWGSQHRSDLVVQTATTRIDFNRAIYGPTPWQPNPRALAPTSISTQGIFGFTEPITAPDPNTTPSLPEFYVRHFVQPEIADRLVPLADDYFPIIDEIMKWCEKKTIDYPIDPLVTHGTITSRAEGALTKAKMEEDHFYPPEHQRIRKTKLARDLIHQNYHAQAKRLTSSRYQDVFCDEMHQDWVTSGPPPVTGPFRQVINGLPWGVFPELPGKPKRWEAPELAGQAAANRFMGKANKAIFEARTCL
jgi:hypothetical protein